MPGDAIANAMANAVAGRASYVMAAIPLLQAMAGNLRALG